MSIATPDDLSSLTSPCRTGNAGVLVADPDPAFALGLKTFLREYVGFDHVLTARNGDEALEILERDPEIEVLTLACEMPGLDGVALLEALSQRERERPLAAVMITGQPSDELEARFRSLSGPRLLARHFLVKPIEFDKIEPLILRAHEEVQIAKESLLREILAKREEAERAAAPGAASEADPQERENVFLDAAQDGAADTAAPGESEPFSGEPAEWERLIRMEADLARHETKLDRIYGEVRKVKRSVRRAFWSLLLGAILVWATLHYGWHEQLEPAWERAKEWSIETWERVSPALPWSAEEAGGAAAETPEATAADALPGEEAAPSEAEGEDASLREPEGEVETEPATPEPLPEVEIDPATPESLPGVEIRQGVPL